ncbi:MAG: glycerophosphodiester phosphodiesterase [Clostridia bacterium]|nr:glycerophosphodiester phosphodiesterase [Clostridia bacterium]
MSFWLGLLALIVIIIVLLYLCLILPRMSGGADMELLRGNYAHRGLWNEQIPENSLPAFALAVQGGYGIELDIRLSRDRVIMVFHDDDLKRMCGVNRRVSDLTCAELKRLRLNETEYSIPTLAEVLSLVGGRVPLMIEVKGEREPRLCQLASQMLDRYPGAFCVESFSPLILNWFKNYRPSYARGQLVTKVRQHERRGSRFANFLLSNMLLNILSRPDFISVNGLYRNRPVFLLCLQVLRTPGFVWTVRNKKDYVTCRKEGWMTIFEKFRP